MRAVIVISGTLLLCGSAIAGTIAQHFFRDPGFKPYSVIFRVTQAPDGSVTDLRLVEVNDVRWQHEHPGAKTRQQIAIPRSYITAATKKARATRYTPLKHTGKPEEAYIFFYYAPKLGDRVIVDVMESE